MAREDLAGAIGEDDLDAGMGLTDGAELDAARGCSWLRAVLGHAVELVDDHAHREEEEEHIGRDGRGG